MAIFRFEAKIITRGGNRSTLAAAAYHSGQFANTGKSAVAAAAYRAGAELTDERTGQKADFTNKHGVLGAEIMSPVGAQAWMRDRQRLWNAVERIEKRRDAQLARDFILTLPHELTQAQRVALTREFVREQFCSKGLIADIAWHAPSPKGDERNFHAHVMVPMRRIEGDGFTATKDRPAGQEHPAKAWAAELQRLRMAFADKVNTHLRAAGLAIEVDHRSLKERGIDREPEPKHGPLGTQIERDGRESYAGRDRRAAQARNAERLRLRTEHAQAEAEIIDLQARRSAERDRQAGRGRMDEQAAAQTDPAKLRQQAEATAKAQLAAERDALDEQVRLLKERDDIRVQEVKVAAARIEAAKQQAEREAELRKKDVGRLEQVAADRERLGDVADPARRYAIAIGRTATARWDEHLMAAAGRESAMFLEKQEAFRRDLANPNLTPARREELTLMMRVEHLEYRAFTDERIAGYHAVVPGEKHQVRAGMLALQATQAWEEAKGLREQLVQLRRDHQQELAPPVVKQTERAAPEKAAPRPQPRTAADRPPEVETARLSEDDRPGTRGARSQLHNGPERRESATQMQERHRSEDARRRNYEVGLHPDRRRGLSPAQPPDAPTRRQREEAEQSTPGRNTLHPTRKPVPEPEMTDAKRARLADHDREFEQNEQTLSHSRGQARGQQR